jgi:UDP-glucose 4-epimerase
MPIVKRRARKSVPPVLARTLVTGADGFIGGFLSNRLEAMGSDVYRLSRKGTGPKTVTNDIGKDPIVGLKEIKPRAVFHLAGRVHRMDEGGDAEAEHIRVTVDGTTYLLQAAVEAGVQAFVFFSTVAVMPEGLATELDERTRAAPTTPYGRAKLRAEELVLGMNGKSGMRTLVLRLPMVYGPGHKGHLPRMIAAIERGVFPPLPQYPGKRSLLHVADAADAAILAAQKAEAAGKVYIVSEPRPYSSREIFEIVLEALGRKPPGWHVPRVVLASTALVGDLGERITRRRLPFDSAALSKLSVPAIYSGRKIERELGFKTKKTFATAAHDVVAQRKTS